MTPTVVARGRSRPARWRSMERGRTVAENGDSFLVAGEALELPGLPGVRGHLVVVADGLGGEGNDDLASQTAVGALEALFRGERPLDEPGLRTADGWLRAAYDRANHIVCDERDRLGARGMYTTLTSGLIVTGADEATLYLANIGDSRLYLLRDGELVALTRDDGEGGYISRVIGDPNVFSQPYLRDTTTVARTEAIELEILGELEQALRGLVTDVAAEDTRPLAALFLTILEGVYPLELAPAYSRPLGILYEGLGAARFEALMRALAERYEGVARRLAPLPLRVGDRLLLCSDGISNALGEAVIADLLATEQPGKPAGEVLDHILERLLETPGRVDDDRTGVVVWVSGGA